MPSFKIIGLLVLEKKIFKGFYHIWTWRPPWSSDLDHLYKLSFPLPKEAPHKIWLWLAKRFQRRRCLNIVDDDDDNDDIDNDETTDARVRVYYKLTLWAWRHRWANNAKYLINYAWKHKKTIENINVHRLPLIYSIAVSRFPWRVFSIAECLKPHLFQIEFK